MFLFFCFVQGSSRTEIHSSKQMIKFSISTKEYHLNIFWAIMFSQHATKNIPVNGFVHQYSFQWCFSEDIPYFFLCINWGTGNMKLCNNWLDWKKYILINLGETTVSRTQKKPHYWKLITLQNLISMMGTEICWRWISTVKYYFPMAR